MSDILKSLSDFEIVHYLLRRQAIFLLILVEKTGVRALPTGHEHLKAIWSKIAATVNAHFVHLQPLTIDDCKAILEKYETTRMVQETQAMKMDSPCKTENDGESDECNYLDEQVSRNNGAYFWQNQFFHLAEQYKSETMVMFMHIQQQLSCISTAISKLGIPL